MYENNTKENLLTALLALVSSSVSTEEGTLTEKALSPFSIELALAYAELERVLNIGFAESCDVDEYLDKRFNEHGIPRKLAEYATVNDVIFSGVDGTVIPINTIIETAIGTQFKTTESKTITGGVATVSIQALEAGIIGNVPANQIVNIVTPVIGLNSVTNPTATKGGIEKETNAEYLERGLFEVQNKGTSGNPSHYKQWALSIANVGDARVFERANGNGTVKVVIINRDKQPADAETVTAVYDYIETVRPACVGVQVVSATSKPIAVTATMALATGYTLEQVKATFETNLTEYLKGIAFKLDYVSYGQVGNVLIDTKGVLDYSALTINSGTANVALTDTEVATIGAVVLS